MSTFRTGGSIMINNQATIIAASEPTDFIITDFNANQIVTEISGGEIDLQAIFSDTTFNFNAGSLKIHLDSATRYQISFYNSANVQIGVTSNIYPFDWRQCYISVGLVDSQYIVPIVIIETSSEKRFSFPYGNFYFPQFTEIFGEIITNSDFYGNGGGATHIAKVTGTLATLENNLSDVLIVAGGGGGGLVSEGTPTAGANGGGISGSGNNSANQSTGYAFGQGEASGGGGGLYGGYKAANGDSGGAGSGYIGNALLDAKKMVGYNVPTSSAESTKTESVNIYSQTAEENAPKAGNGFARIKWLRGLSE